MLPILYRHGKTIGRCDMIKITQKGVFIYFVLCNKYTCSKKLSIGYKILKTTYNGIINIINSLVIYEISVVNNPAQKVYNYEEITKNEYYLEINK